MYKSKKGGLVGVIITVIILIMLVIFTNVDNTNLSYLENVASKLVMPVQNGLTYLKNKINGNENFFYSIDNLKKENEELKDKNSQLELQLRELEIIKSENETLKAYVNLTDKYKEYKTIPACVINRDISNYSKTIIINVGSKDGISEDMTVIADEGLVGYVISVTDYTSKVQTIVDSASATSCLLSTSRDSIVCKGILDINSMLKAMYIATDANVIQGDSVETSGIGGIYPKGIHIGTVQKVVNSTNATDRYALVETKVDFEKLETVLVITN